MDGHTHTQTHAHTTLPLLRLLMEPKKNLKLFKDCPYKNQSQFKHVPLPYPRSNRVHPVILCPTFENDHFVENEISKLSSDLPKVSDKNCDGIQEEGFGNLTECMTLDQCEDILESPNAPTNIHVCGWDGSVAKMMICCTKRKITSAASTLNAPRFPKYKGQPRIENMDKSPFCQLWKAYGACKLDKHFSIRINDSSYPYPGEDTYYADYYNIFDDEYDYGSEVIYPGVYDIESWDMFSFMQKACMTTCGWTWPGTAIERNKGCVDEHVKCTEWAKKGGCYTNPKFMTHTCRESCGVCGFLSPNNKEEQVVSEKSYTNIKNDDFECGRSRGETHKTVTPISPIGSKYSESYCGATVISDR